jgi:flagellin
MVSLRASRYQNEATRSLQDSFRKLSSGNRIERVADDAAGLAVSENLHARASSQRVAIRNANDGISVIQTMEGGVSEVSDMLKRMRELAVQSSSETLASTERAYLNDEFKQMQSEIGRLRETTDFNGTNLLNGSWISGKDVQVGANDSANDRIAIVMGDVSQTDSSASMATFTTGTVGVPGGNKVTGDFSIGAVGSVAGGTATVYNISNVLSDGVSRTFGDKTSALARANAINTGTGTHGVTAVANASTYEASGNVTAGTFAGGSRFFFAGGTESGDNHIYINGITVVDNDTDKALETHLQNEMDTRWAGIYTVDTSSGKINISAEDGRTFRFNLTDSGGYAGITTGAWQYGSGTFSLSSASDFEYQATSPSDWGVSTGTNVVSATGGSSSIDLTNNASINVSTVAAAQLAIGNLDQGLDTMNSHRSKLGAVQNRLESAIQNLQTNTETTLAARSRIRDADFAFETAQLSKAQMMQSASTSVLAQGNQLPQMALRLIG